MTVDITFYGDGKQESRTIEMSEETYEWLTKSDFSEIGMSRKAEVEIDGEKQEIKAVDLEKGTISNRQRLKDFFEQEIVKESGNMISKFDDFPSKDDYREYSARLRKLHEIFSCLVDKKYRYLQRVT